MIRNSALEKAHRIISDQVGMWRIGGGPDPEVACLAEDVGMADQVLTRPHAVAAEITAYLDDIARNP
jgi:hypothetical protein